MKKLIISIGIIVIVVVLGILIANIMQTSKDYRCPDCNVILISIDTLRADHLGCYGYERNTSPNIDKFAKESILFEQAVKMGGGTMVNHMSMLTSLYPEVHNVTYPEVHNDPQNGTRLASERITLAEQLKEAGCVTAGFVDGGWISDKFGFGQGFDNYLESGGGLKVILPKINMWLEDNSNKKFFLFIHAFDVHSKWDKLPYESPEGYNDLFLEYSGNFTGCLNNTCASSLLLWFNEKMDKNEIKIDEYLSKDDFEYIIALYDGGIAYTDKELGLFFEELNSRGIYDNTLIIVTADHGEQFLEHGRFLHPTNYEEVAHVPLIIKLPNSSIKGKRISDLVATVDIMPTSLDIVGVEINSEAQGLSLAPLITENKKLDRKEIHISGLNITSEKIRSEEWSLFISANETTPIELYYLIDDPLEQNNVIEANPEISNSMYSKFKELIAEERKIAKSLAKNTSSVELTREEIDRLKSLGYLNWSERHLPLGLTSDAPAIAAFNNRLYMVVRAVAGDTLWINSGDATDVWAGWTQLDGTTPSAASLAVFNGRLYLAVRGGNNVIYYRSMDTSGIWSSWNTVQAGTSSDAPALAVFNSKLYIVVKSSGSEALYMNSSVDGTNWSGWKRI